MFSSCVADPLIGVAEGATNQTLIQGANLINDVAAPLTHHMEVKLFIGASETIASVRLLGMDGYGLVSGVIMLFASNVNRLLSFRMSEVVVKYLGEALAEEKLDRAAAIAKGIGLVEAVTSVIAYLVLLALTPWAASTFAKDASTAPLFAFYGLFLLSNLIFETSTGVLQATDRFDRVAVINLVQSIITAVMIFADFLLKRGVMDILTAYLVARPSRVSR